VWKKERVVKRAFQSGEDCLLVEWSKPDEGFIEALEGFGDARGKLSLKAGTVILVFTKETD